jgi:hypothetical protein
MLEIQKRRGALGVIKLALLQQIGRANQREEWWPLSVASSLGCVMLECATVAALHRAQAIVYGRRTKEK